MNPDEVGMNLREPPRRAGGEVYPPVAKEGTLSEAQRSRTGSPPPPALSSRAQSRDLASNPLPFGVCLSISNLQFPSPPLRGPASRPRGCHAFARESMTSAAVVLRRKRLQVSFPRRARRVLRRKDTWSLFRPTGPSQTSVFQEPLKMGVLVCQNVLTNPEFVGYTSVRPIGLSRQAAQGATTMQPRASPWVKVSQGKIRKP